MLKVKFRKTNPAARPPRYATDGSGAFDLFAAALDDTTVTSARAEFDTGLAFEIPEGHVMLVFSRSGHGFRHGVRLVNGVGVIDSDYRGTVKVALRRDKNSPQSAFRWDEVIHQGAAVAQAIILPFPRAVFEEAHELSSTARGFGGFGSTDQKTIIPPGAFARLASPNATGGKLACPDCGNEHRVERVSDFVAHCRACGSASPVGEAVMARLSSSRDDFFVWPNGVTLRRTEQDSEAFRLALEASKSYCIVRPGSEEYECIISDDVPYGTADTPKDE